MKLGILTVPFSQRNMDEIVPYLKRLGVEAVELGTGGVTDKSHCDPDILLKDPEKRKHLLDLLESNEMVISALSCHGNPVHPDAKKAQADHDDYLKTIELANLLGVDTIVTFSGCPGDGPTASHANWVTCPWPPEFSQVLDYQWNEVLIPYWKKAGKIAEDAGVKVAIEMHPGFCVYNSETMLKLRQAVGESVGANFDPSHLFWMGINPVMAIRELGEAIYYVHAKDCKIDQGNSECHGVLDTKHYSNFLTRSWSFRTVGYGHGVDVWTEIISNLRMVGYDKTISIEHEDGLMSVSEGVEKAIQFMKQIMISQPSAEMWWA